MSVDLTRIAGVEQARDADPTLSVVVPAYDEADNLERLLAEVRAALDPTGLRWELVVGRRRGRGACWTRRCCNP